jgi:hypothetical protein
MISLVAAREDTLEFFEFAPESSVRRRHLYVGDQSATQYLSGVPPTVLKRWPSSSTKHEIAQRIDNREDFGRQAAFGATNGLILSPPFAPCPWRCILTIVTSTIAYSMSGSSEAASKSRLKTSDLTHGDNVSRSRNPQHGLNEKPVIRAAPPGIARLPRQYTLN